MIDWIKKNKLTFALILIVGYFLFKNFFQTLFGVQLQSLDFQPSYKSTEKLDLAPAGQFGGVSNRYSRQPIREAPPSQSEDRLVVQTSSMSLVVKEVRESVNAVIDYADQIGGFMVSSSLTHPEEAPYARLIIRVPSTRLQETLGYLRDIAVRVTSENIQGKDVTSEYEDIQAKLSSLAKTKAKFEEILEKATKIDDILRVNREIINLQKQIDNLKGRQQYLGQTAKLAKITLHLSTDEYALPYAPAKPFRPAVIFKQAVRSLVKTLRKVVSTVIWIAVYGVIWVPILTIIIWWKRRKKNRPSPTSGPKP